MRMIRFRIAGASYLQLPGDFKFSFSYNNTLFAFDNMQVSRSTEFQVPATPENNLILGFSNDPSTDGTYIRTKKQAELFYSGGKIDGHLYFGKYSKGNYSAIFVYGELEAIKTAKGLGNIVDYCNFTETLPTVSPTFRTAYYLSGQLLYGFAWYNYKNGLADGDRLNGAMNYSPSVKLNTLIQQAAVKSGIGINVTNIGQAINSIALILPTQKKSAIPITATFSGIPNSTLNVSGSVAGYIGRDGKSFLYKPSLFWLSRNVYAFVCEQDLTLKITGFAGYTHIVTNRGKEILTIGGNVAGEPYSIKVGDEYTFKKGDYFTFVHFSNYWYGVPRDPYDVAVSVSAEIRGANQTEIGIGDTYYLQDNLPEVTFTDLLKTVANLLKMGIDYDVASNTLSFFDFAFDKSQAIELDSKTIEISSVDRTFLDYAQRNVVDFKSEEYVKQKYDITYSIFNDSVSGEKRLYTIPFSEGNFDTENNVVVQDFDPENKKTAKTATIGIASKVSGQTYLKHVSQLYKNVTVSRNLAEIINNSTTIVWVGRMIAGDFLKLKNKNTYKYRGQYYCCIDGTHTDGTATLTLVKI